MANKPGHRRFGNVRLRESGRWQARYPGPDGRLRPAPMTFATKRDAEQWLTLAEARMIRGDWIDPQRSAVPFGAYAERWIRERPSLRPRTVELYGWLFRKHLEPKLGTIKVGDLSTALIREWRSDLLAAGVSQSVAAKSYRLLRAILNTAVQEDGLIARNPCRVRGADHEHAAERPVLTVAQVFQLADAMRYQRLRVMILVAAFATLRWGEVTALRRCDVAPDGSWIRVNFAHTEVVGRGIVVGPPKSRAGVRTIAVPTAVRGEIVKHLMAYVDSRPDALLFTGPQHGRALRRAHFNNLTKWVETVRKLGVPGLHFHDLRHTGNHFAAQTGASTKDLMARMGHDDMRAALIYQRATSEADQRIADRMSTLVDGKEVRRDRPDDDDDGVAGVLVPAR
ncbi:MAG: tyrosine-type recombinase/integrase family protein [Pseudonocardia sp.]|mgnify:FL=1|uniref:tyrosine-type recombinase/integrase n=1 Tax=Pseudonocardia sp. TaxID=60912 RepID=UPI001ACC0316|nr:site-specific integrase [Pseudonocardia sp.]MBN9098848.1 tyrosine-type recombinase/integrase family protein [Pseudonocardia sp.]